MSEEQAARKKSPVGLKSLKSETAAVSSDQVDRFAQFLERLALESDRKRELREEHLIERVAGSRVQWSRLSRVEYPVYFERITVVDAAKLGATTWPVPARIGADGELVVSSRVFEPGNDHYEDKADNWRKLFRRDFADGARLEGGLTFNVLRISASALESGDVDIRPLSLHALAPDWRACDRGHAPSQAAVANSFWQTFWATGALRTERGATFPVGFLPIDRTLEMEIEPPFGMRQVSPQRTLLGRTAILAFINETLTKTRALYFDRVGNRFCVSKDFDCEQHHVPSADVCLAIHELNRTGFVDAYTGANKELFDAWRVQEEKGVPGKPWAAAEASVGNIEAVRCDPGSDNGRFVRIPRVVPYAGCAYLHEIMSDFDELMARGKVQNFGSEILAATNSTFFLNFPEEYAVLDNAMNDAVALLIENGSTIQGPLLRRATFLLGADAKASITKNLEPDPSFNPKHAFAVGPMLVQGGEPVALGTNGEEFQPIVLRESPSFQESCDLARTELPPALLNCEKRGVPPTRFPYDWDKTRAPRTAIGIAPDGGVLVVVVDGRADLQHSVGVTLAELADLMIELGCDSAMNLDGGGSSVMHVSDPGVHKFKIKPGLRDGVVNLPSDLGGNERLLPVPLVICRRRSGNE